MSSTVTITRDTDLGYASNNEVERNEANRTMVRRPTEPQMVGNVRALRAARVDALRVHGVAPWREAVFLNGTRLAEHPADVIDQLAESDETTVTLEA